MAASRAPKPRAPRRRWPLTVKRRIAELTLRAGVSVRTIALEHGVHPTCLSHWRRHHRAGKLEVQPTPRGPTSGASATFLPVSIVPAVGALQPAPRPVAGACGGHSVVQLMLASGATLRIETAPLDAALVCVLKRRLPRPAPPGQSVLASRPTPRPSSRNSLRRSTTGSAASCGTSARTPRSASPSSANSRDTIA